MIQAIRGMNDILPVETPFWQHLETVLRHTLLAHGYYEIRFPIVEKTELFKRSIGEATDIVEKEMYTFTDRNNDSLTLRPEGTAVCVRAGIEHGLLFHQTPRLWYQGPYFRHERPQKGRYRQFHQCGVEAFGMEGPDIDAEVILLSAHIFKKLGLMSHIHLELNSLGSSAARAHYRELLVQYFTQHFAQLDEDSQRRLQVNPLRILDSKNPAMQTLINNAPKLLDHLDPESAQDFTKLQSYLNQAGLQFTINPRLVRGLDYYNKTVFEWVTSELGAQSSVCSGGRYDGLVAELGGKPTPAFGFAIGLERIVLLMQQLQLIPDTGLPHIYFMTDGEASFQAGLTLANQLRETFPLLRILLHCGGGSFKNQFKKADKSGAKLAFILGEQELQTQTVAVKFLRENTEQLSVKITDLEEFISSQVI